jgi:hypothetical protein
LREGGRRMNSECRPPNSTGGFPANSEFRENRTARSKHRKTDDRRAFPTRTCPAEGLKCPRLQWWRALFQTKAILLAERVCRRRAQVHPDRRGSGPTGAAPAG